MRFFMYLNAWTKARSLSTSEPSTAADPRSMRGHRLAWPERARSAGRAVADREHEIHLGRPRSRELVPVLRTEAGAG
jgi:hypothetical protein